MADQQKADASQTEGQGQSRSARSSSAGGQNAQQPADQERQRQVSREPGSAGTGVQRGSARQSGTGASLARRGQPSVLPALIADPGLMTSAFMTNPFAFAQAVTQEMDRLFDTFGGASESRRGMSNRNAGRGLQQRGGQQTGGQDIRDLASFEPQMEVLQRGNEIVVRADLPGLSPDDVQIDVDDGILTISGERQQTIEDRDQGLYHTERVYGAFARSIALPDGVDPEQVQARFDNGVLEVIVPIPEQQRQRGRRVQIQSSTGERQNERPNERQNEKQSAGQSSGRQSSGQQIAAQGSTTQGGAAQQSPGQQSAGQHSGTQSGAGGSTTSA